jgi:7,8-dihydropterin-6-yl-methyl-4-(beta-D-ribofuranosyl)aminobenzene 5'-phosphate synthase
LTNNCVLPFQNLQKEDDLNFVELNKLFASKSLAEHGLGFLINFYDLEDLDEKWGPKLIKKIIFDTGGEKLTFLHNLDLMGYDLNNVNNIILSHWHHDHTGGLYKILGRINKDIQVICHNDANYERFFRRSEDVKPSDLKGKTRDEISHLLDSSKIVNQEPISHEKIEKLNGKVFYTKNSFKLLNNEDLKIIVSGEIPRKYPEEEFDNFFSLHNSTLKIDKILDDKCLILEYERNVVLLNGCCHSGLMNTLDYVKELSDKPVSHIIGGFHMASASEDKIRNTIGYLRTFQDYDYPLFIFPIHCSGDNFIRKINQIKTPIIKAYNCSVGTVFNFRTGF